MLKPHALILNRFNDLALGSQSEGRMHLFCSMAPLIDANPTANYIFTEPILESTYQTPISYDLAHLNAENLVPEGSFYLKLGIQYKSEFYHEIEGIVNLENLHSLSAPGYRKWEVSDAVISATILFKEEIPSLGN